MFKLYCLVLSLKNVLERVICVLDEKVGVVVWLVILIYLDCF